MAWGRKAQGDIPNVYKYQKRWSQPVVANEDIKQIGMKGQNRNPHFKYKEKVFALHRGLNTATGCPKIVESPSVDI